MPRSKPMSGTFNATVADEKRLRAAHFAPVLRWVRFGPRPREKAVTTAEAYAIIDREMRKKAAREKASA
jgi:hypothetical protein